MSEFIFNRPKPVYILLLSINTFCGYHLNNSKLHKVSNLEVPAPELRGSGDPLLVRHLHVALRVELVRRGASLAGPGQKVSRIVRVRVLSVGERDVAVVERRIVQRAVVVRLEAWMTTGDGQTIWRSHLIEVEEPAVQPAETVSAQEQRSAALERLARRAAADVAACLELASGRW